MYFINYSKCSTCKRAKKFLDDNNISYIDRQIKEDNPSYDEIKSWMEVMVKTRYSAKEAKAKIKQVGKNIKVVFDEPQRAITPGQSAVFYIDDIVLGGGKII